MRRGEGARGGGVRADCARACVCVRADILDIAVQCSIRSLTCFHDVMSHKTSKQNQANCDPA